MKLPRPNEAGTLREADRELQVGERVYPKKIAAKHLDAYTAARCMESSRDTRRGGDVGMSVQG